MADVESLDDDRDTALPASALSPAEYRSFRTLVTEVKGVNTQASLYSVLEFLTTFNAVSHGVAQQVVDVVLGPEQGEFVGDGHVYAMVRLVGHWQTDGRIEKSMIFVQARVPERTGSKSSSSSSHEHAASPSLAPTSTTLNPFRANSTASTSSSTARTAGVDRGVEAFKRLMFAKSKEGSQSDAPTTEPTEGSVGSLPPPAVKLEDSASLFSTRTDQSHTGMTFVYTSDEEDDVGSSVKHSPETQLRESPQPILPTTSDRRSLPPLSIPLSSPQKPAPPPSRKRGASGSNQPSTPVDAENKAKLEEKIATAKRNFPPAPPAPRRTLSSASTPRVRPERSSSIRQPAPPPPTSSDTTTKPPPPRARRKLSDTSVSSFDIQQPRLSSESQQQPDPPQTTSSAPIVANKRLSVQAPPPPPPPRGRKHDVPPSSPTSRRSTDLPTRLGLERPESPRRASAPDHEKPKISELQDSELSLELGRLQREVDELVYGLTKKRGGTSGS